jgi:hypothetical protein
MKDIIKRKMNFFFVFYSTVPLLFIYFKRIKSHNPGHLAFIYSDVTWDVLLGLFVDWNVLKLGHFVDWDVLWLGCIAVTMFCSLDVLQLGR